MKKIFPIAIVVSLAFYILLSLPCHGNLVCSGPSTSTHFSHIGLWLLILIPLSLFSLTLNNEKHYFWVKLTGILFLISMILIFLLPEYDRGIVSIDRELANWFFAFVYSVVSIGYFIFQYFKGRKA